MNPKALIPLVAGLAIAGFAAKMGFDHIKNAQGSTTKMVTLWTVQEDVPRGSPVAEQNLRPLEFPLEVTPENALTKKESIVGRVPHTGVPAGVPILNSMLLAPGQMPGINVPEGFRAVAVKVDESSGVDSHLEPGVHVDVVGLFSIRNGNRSQTIAKTVVEKVQVAAVGQRIAPKNPNAAEDDKRRPAKPARAVTLIVRPEHVPQLHMAEQRGKIKLSMRSTGAELQVASGQSNEITENELLGFEDESEESSKEEQASGANPIASFFESLFGEEEEEPVVAEAEPEPQPEPEPVVEKKPEVVWTMAIYNGENMTRLGWTAQKPFEPITLGETSGGNIFEDDGYEPFEPREPTGPRRGNRNRKNQQRRNGSEADDGEPNEPAEVVKPQELFG